jgi:hypothetical protein
MKAYGVNCLNNQKQLTLAWKMYADDNADFLCIAGDARGDGSQPLSSTWVGGVMDFDPANPSNWDVNKDIAKSPLWNYGGKSAKIWKCPADRSTVTPSVGPLAGKTVPRIRSMAMNCFIGGTGGSLDAWGDGFAGYRVYMKFSDMTDPGPSKTFVFVDIREDSVNTGTFGVSMSGYPDRPDLLRFNQDIPASYHLKAGGLSFADGHSEIKRWLDPRTMPKVRKGIHLPLVVFPSPNNQDVSWLQDRTTRPGK